MFEIILIRKIDLLTMIKLVKPKLISDFIPVDLYADYLLNITMDDYKYGRFINDFGNPLYRF